MNNTINNSEFKILTSSIIREYFPKEEPISKLFMDEQIHKLTKGEDILVNSTIKGEFEFGESVVEALKFLSVLAGTFKAVISLINLQKEKLSKDQSKNGKIQTLWEKELVEAGLDKELSKKIVNKFHNQMIQLIS